MQIQKETLVFPELSYKTLGAAFSTFNELGWGLAEKDYQRGLAKELEKMGIHYEREVYIPLKYKSESVGRFFADFVIEGKIILELKVVPKLGYAHTRQLLGYLIGSGYKLGILIYFTKDGVKHRRVLNSRV